MSVDAAPRFGVTTGISAQDRATTIRVLVDPATVPGRSASRPATCYPLRARDGGVLQRVGHTEAAVDLARLAGLYPAGVICEILNEDGTTAQASAARGVRARARAHVHHGRAARGASPAHRAPRAPRRRGAPAHATYGEWKVYGYRTTSTPTSTSRITYGDVARRRGRARAHALEVPHRRRLPLAALRLRLAARHGDGDDRSAKGAASIVYLDQEGRGIGLLNKLKAYELQDAGARHGRGERTARLRARPPQLRHRRADPPRPRAQARSGRSRTIRARWSASRATGSSVDERVPIVQPATRGERRLPGHQARQARAPPRFLIDDMAEFSGIANGAGRGASPCSPQPLQSSHVTRSSSTARWTRSSGTARRRRTSIVVWVPGAWELPFAARRLAATERYDALVVVGAVIRGDTPHFDYVAGEASRGLAAGERRVRHPDRLRPPDDATRWSRPKRAPAARTATRDGMRPSPRSRWRTSSSGSMRDGRELRRARACPRPAGALCVGHARRRTSSSASRSQVWDDLAVAPEERRVAAPIVRHVAQRQRELDAELADVTTNWRLERLGAIERCVLRMAAAELSIGETPPRVVIQEAVTLAERFGSDAERAVRQRRARRARASHGADVGAAPRRQLAGSRESAGGRRRDPPARDLRAARRAGPSRSRCSAADGPAVRRARRSTAWRSSASARATPSRSWRARFFRRAARRPRVRPHGRGRQQGAAVHAAVGRAARGRARAASLRRNRVPGARRTARGRRLARRASAWPRVPRRPVRGDQREHRGRSGGARHSAVGRGGDLSRDRHGRVHPVRTAARSPTPVFAYLGRLEALQGRASRHPARFAAMGHRRRASSRSPARATIGPRSSASRLA